MHNRYLNNINIILNKTLYAGNIGSTARAMKNMGLSNLYLVEPQCEIDGEARKMATHGMDILENIKIFDSISDAASESNYIFGTTARSRKWRGSISPTLMSDKISKIAGSNKISILFGPEDFGLTNNELELCNEVVVISTADDAASINISQAVLIIGYEIFQNSVHTDPGSTEKQAVELASIDQIEDMYSHMKKALLDIGYLDPQNPEHFVGNFRRILDRAELSSEEVQMIRGIFRKLNWYINNIRK